MPGSIASWLILILSGLALLASGGRPAPAVTQARLLERQGSVRCSRSGLPVPEVDAAVGQTFFTGDRVRTLEASRALLEFTSLTRLTLGELTVLEIREPPSAGERPVLELLRGALSFFSRQRPRDLEIRTRHAVAGARGTEFLVEVGPDETVFTVFDGMIEVTTDRGAASAAAGFEVIARIGHPPVLRPVIEARSQVQWWLYYPAVLDPAELRFTPAERAILRPSLEAWQLGDLLQALREWPDADNRDLASDTCRIYRAGLLLAVGGVAPAGELLDPVTRDDSLALALRYVIRAVSGAESPDAETFASEPPRQPATASEWLGWSHVLQARHDLAGAIAAARRATEISPAFGHAWARLALLQFGGDPPDAALTAVAEALRWTPRNAAAIALRGFLRAGEGRVHAALATFEEALSVDPSLPDAWLGRGLCRLRLGQTPEGHADLLTAAALEPRRSLLRSYLSKALADSDDPVAVARAGDELERAATLDPADPTPHLYRALLLRRRNQINPAIRALEDSIARNENRSLYRSRLLLDEDLAVRSANLAGIYRDAGLTSVSLAEAVRAVTHDYANYSAHLFFAESLEALRDPTRVSLRYETAWFGELLLASLLAPIGAGPLSRQISDQEYSRLFTRDGPHLDTTTEYFGDGRFRQLASQSGLLGRIAWAADVEYQRDTASATVADLERLEWYTQVRVEAGPRDSALLLTKVEDLEAADNLQYEDPGRRRPDYRLTERQSPLAVAGWHHQWTPYSHTFVLAGRLENHQTLSDRGVNQAIVSTDAAGRIGSYGILGLDPSGTADIGGMDLEYRSEFVIYTGELTQLWQSPDHTLIGGVRAQAGEFDSAAQLDRVRPVDFAPFFGEPAAASTRTEEFARTSVYLYDTWNPVPPLHVTAGVSYDRLTLPLNFRYPPLEPGDDTRDQVLPKAAVQWSPRPGFTLRGAYARSLGGVSFDESFRLEPVLLAGFSQAFRTVIPESLVGSVAGPRHETWGLAGDLRLASQTWLTLEYQAVGSRVDRRVGAFLWRDDGRPAVPRGLSQTLDYREHEVQLGLSRLFGDHFSAGVGARLTLAELARSFPELPPALAGARSFEQAWLLIPRAFVRYRHPRGFLAEVECRWFTEERGGDLDDRPGDSLGQVDVHAGWRFWRGRGEVLAGGLNLTGEAPRLHPLTLRETLPGDRILHLRLRFSF